MPVDYIFWGLMIIWIVFYFADGRSPTPRYPWGGAILEFVLFALLGWKVFGSAVK